MTQPMRKALLVAYFVILPMAMLYPLWVSPTSAGEDDAVYYWPLRALVSQAVQAGQFPHWNPYEAGGVPLFADPQSGLFFPPNWIFFLWPTTTAYALTIFLAFSVAGGGAWLYLRRIGLSVLPALVGATVFMFSGFMVGHRVHLSLIQAAAFLPWGLLGIEKARDSWRSGVLWLAPAYALMLAAGHWPTAIHVSVVWGAYLLLRGRPLGRAAAAFAASGAIAALLLGPQIYATAAHLANSVRSSVPYVVAGENSFLPASLVLAFYPFIFGSRTPNFFPQDWWGPWHLCEMLGYVGLATLVLALAAMVTLYRKKRVAGVSRITGVSPVRVWTWIMIGAFVWALGYYTPIYRLIHKIPVVGVVRCPARMLLAIDFALAVLAAIGLQALLRAGALGATASSSEAVPTVPESGSLGHGCKQRTRGTQSSRGTRIGLFVRLGAAVVLPVGMTAGLGLVWGIGWAVSKWPMLGQMFNFSYWGIKGTIAAALRPTNSALVVPMLLSLATMAVLLLAAWRPRRLACLVLPLLLADLFFIARFVDVPAGIVDPTHDPTLSPAAKWLAEHPEIAPPGQYRVWGLAPAYHHRPGELLLPKTSAVHGIKSISQYGPFQPGEHAMLFGFRPWGHCEAVSSLLEQRNHLLSLSGVKFVLAWAPPDRPSVIPYSGLAARVPGTQPAPEGPNLLEGKWLGSRGPTQGDHIVLKADHMWVPDVAEQVATMEPDTTYRLTVEARAPHGAQNFFWLKAQTHIGSGGPHLRVDVEQIRPEWRQYELTMKSAEVPVSYKMIIECWSESPIEFRHMRLRRSDPPTSPNLGEKLAPGEFVYEDLTPDGLPPLRPGDPPVHIYLNKLWQPTSLNVRGKTEDQTVRNVELIRNWDGKSPLPAGLVGPFETPPPVDGRLPWTALASAAGLAALVCSVIRWRRPGPGARP